jgi:hypothetical protein
MNIQEEGHAPSDTLKSEIARSLVAGGLDVPFVYTPDPVRTPAAPTKKQPAASSGEKTGKEAEEASSRRKRSAATTAAAPKKEAESPKQEVAAAESVIKSAVANGDLNAVIEAIETHHAKENMEAIR